MNQRLTWTAAGRTMYGTQQSVTASSGSLDQGFAYSTNNRLRCVSAGAATSTYMHINSYSYNHSQRPATFSLKYL